MKRGRRTLWTLAVLLLSCVTFSSEAYPWGSATHVYIDDHLGRKRGLNNLNEMYGGMVPDLFNYMFESPYLNELYATTHYEYMKVWRAARTIIEKSVAFGFVSHNDEWGADSTAHHSGRFFGQGEGYVVAKANLLLQLAPLPPELSIPPAAAQEIYHNIVESAVDILLKRLDSAIGKKMISSALFRNPVTPFLLIKAYSKELSPYFGGHVESVKAISSAEREFRKTMVLYGEALTQDEETAIQLVSEQMADLAESFLAAYQITLPLPKDQVIGIIVDLVTASMQLCGPDYSDELDETIQFVDQQLDSHGISY